MDICAPARGVRGDGFSNFARGGDGSPLLAIAQHEETLESRLHSSFCFIFLFQGSRFLLGVFRGSFLSHDSSLG